MVYMDKNKITVLILGIAKFYRGFGIHMVIGFRMSRIVSIPCRIQYCVSMCFDLLCFRLPCLVEVSVPMVFLGVDKLHFE